MISFLWAEDKNHVIGYKGRLPWKLPNDMKRFKDLTIGKSIVMGRRTYESFPNGPLPKRLNIVMSRNSKYQVKEPAVLINDISDLSKYVDMNSEIVVIGGSKIFEAFKDIVDRLYLTKIDYEFKGDVKMIDLDYSKFKLIEKEGGIMDEKNIYPYTFETYQRI
ncbi:dihydrofolate reductase [Companilactobacillus tucceti DSM 20183]|uniref:Dihydrofolate reductase n=1 Tax=Companilactobacillus tucceti DSM 20183 TaxID=1423811 RepID=A0A0R1JCM8_9LACO|nr:dihydrofolate reductase [Companilactobacillus tucceti]KRK65506.1 dihydrofolate reductase [Companilactobacillus tucceti DSM 20183]